MAKHIIFIDPLDKLIPKKDSSLLLAHELKAAGADVKILFKNELFLTTGSQLTYKMFDFSSELSESFYLSDFEIKKTTEQKIESSDTIHMRLEPPFDLSYMRNLWILDYLKREIGCKVINDPNGIFVNNEKISSFVAAEFINTFIGTSVDKFMSIVHEYRGNGVNDIILKPIDLFQGIGVRKVNLSLEKGELANIFIKMTEEFKGPVLVQPFQEEILGGEIRAIFFNHKLMGAIKKIPKKGSYLANIAQGATFNQVDLNSKQSENCHKVCRHLGDSVPWVAFDIIGNKISEVNVTCPGLLVEVSNAENRNIAFEIAKEILSN